MKSTSIQASLYPALVTIVFTVSMIFLFYGMTQPDWHDFDVFYSAAKSALSGESIYIVVGEYNLPFWYFPWTAWLYIPFAIWPENIALILYKATFVICAILVVNSLLSYYFQEFRFLDRVLVLSLLVPMSLQVMIVGQMEYILLGLLLLTMYAIDQGRFLLAGILFPFLWTKPHVLIVFTLIAFWHGGRRVVVTSFITSAILLLIETVISPGWHLEMLALLKSGQNRTSGLMFTTFPSLLGSQENWIGTGNIPFTILLIIVALLIVWKFRSLPTVPLLSLALAASLFCAPRAYAYDLPLLIPTMIWITAKNFRSTYWIWIVAAILPPLTRFSSSAYLLTLLIFVLGVRKAYLETRQGDQQLSPNHSL